MSLPSNQISKQLCKDPNIATLNIVLTFLLTFDLINVE